MATVEEVKQEAEAQRQRIQQALIEQQQAEANLRLQRQLVQSDKVRRQTRGLEGLRQRQAIQKEIATSQEVLNQRQEQINQAQANVAQAEQSIKDYESKVAAINAEKRAYERAMQIYLNNSRWSGKDDRVRYYLDMIREQRGGSFQDYTARKQEQFNQLQDFSKQYNISIEEANKILSSQKNIDKFMESKGYLGRSTINSPTGVEYVQTTQLKTQDNIIQQTRLPQPTVKEQFNKLLDKNIEEYAQANPKPKLYGKQGEYAVLNKESIGYQLNPIGGLAETIPRAVEYVLPEKTRVKLYLKERTFAEENPLTYKISRTGGRVVLDTASASLLGPYILTGAAQTAPIVAAEAKALAQARKANIEFVGKANDKTLRIVAKTEVGGKEIKIIQKYEYVKDAEGNIIGVKGFEISKNPTVKKEVYELNLREVITKNNLLKAKGYNVKEGILSEFSLEGPVITKVRNPIKNADNTNFYLSEGASTMRKSATISTKKLNRLGLLDTIDESSVEVLKKGQIGKVKDYEPNLKRSSGVYKSEKIDSLPVRNKFDDRLVTLEKVKGDVYYLEGGPTKLRVYKEGKLSYIYDKKIKGYLKVESFAEDSGSGITKVLINKQVVGNVPIASVQEGMKTAINKELPQILKNVKVKPTLTQKASSGISQSIKSEPLTKLDKSIELSLQAEEKKELVNNVVFKKSINPEVNQAKGVRPKAKQAEDQIIKPAQDISFISVQGSRNKLIEKAKQAEDQIIKPAQDINFISVQGSRTLMRAILKTKTVMREKMDSKSTTVNINKNINPRPPNPKPQLILKLPKDIDYKEIDSIADSDDFTAFTLKKGQKTRLFSGSKLGQLIGKAKKSIRGDLSASLIVENEKGKSISLGGFVGEGFVPSKKSGVFRLIQLAKLRLSSLGERRQIKAARKNLKKWL